jgi:signal transduction histidine kinase
VSPFPKDLFPVSLRPMTTQQEQLRTSARSAGALERGVLAARDRLVTATRRFPLLADAALAAVLLVLSVPPLTALRGSNHALSLLLVAAIVAPIAWRRRAPYSVCLLIAVLAVLQWFTSRELTVYLAVLVAFYTVAAHAQVRRVLVAGALLEAGAVLAATHWPVPGAHAAWGWLIATGLIVAAGLLGYYIRTARQAHRASLAQRAERLEREREQQAQLAVAAERSRIARELHDIVAHNIAMMIALAEGAAATAAESPGQAVSLMGDISSAGRAALSEMRRLLGVLRQPVLSGHAPQPSLADLDNLLAGVRTAGLPTRLTVTGEPFGVPASAQLALYRMVQEALTNSIKHAPGASAEVCLTYLPGAVELEVTDDGRRDEPAPANAGKPLPAARADGGIDVPGSGHGLVGMRERAAVFGGKVTAGSRPGGGWRVHTILRLGAEGSAHEAAIGEDAR